MSFSIASVYVAIYHHSIEPRCSYDTAKNPRSIEPQCPNDTAKNHHDAPQYSQLISQVYRRKSSD